MNESIDINKLIEDNKTDNIICDSDIYITNEIIDNSWNHDEDKSINGDLPCFFDNSTIIYNSTIHICKDLLIMNDNDESESEN